ncbi:hypothetical protein [Brevibacterium pigmentatum]|uniref:hypothetical protein n=1 Tax=Brevibacterium pigmentatum TaxID=1496080 RepID=UPI00141F0BC8|nr:hypothetical protein [Brevibacterium pigmentatum]
MKPNSRYVPAAPYRAALEELSAKHSQEELARRLRVTPRTIWRALSSESVKISRTFAEAILFEAGMGPEPEPVQERAEDPITWPEVAEFAKTTEGLEFIERCWRPAAYRTRKAA